MAIAAYCCYDGNFIDVDVAVVIVVVPVVVAVVVVESTLTLCLNQSLFKSSQAQHYAAAPNTISIYSMHAKE